MEFCDLGHDPEEQHDVAAQHPAIVARLAKIMEKKHAPSANFPWPGDSPIP